MGWGQMSCMQQTARVIMVIAVIAVIACIVYNCVAIWRSVDETWFVPCEDCKKNGGSRDCNRCCTDCTWKDEVFYYIVRAYTLIFCIFAILAELKLEFFDQFLKMCNFFFPRGMWQIFIGLMTVEANIVPRNDRATMWSDIIGYCLVIVGVLHLFLGCCCWQEYSKEKREKEEKELHVSKTAAPSQI